MFLVETLLSDFPGSVRAVSSAMLTGSMLQVGYHHAPEEMVEERRRWEEEVLRRPKSL